MTIPSGWEEKRLGDFIDFKNGINADHTAYGQGIKFVNVMDIFKNKTLSESMIRGYVSATEKQIQDYSVIYGDILFNRTSETEHEIAMSSVYLCNEPAVFGGFVIRGRQRYKILDTRFSIFCFQSKKTRKDMIRLGQGAIRSNMGQKDLSKITLLIPPLPEQQKIAEIIGTWDKAIDIQEKLIANSINTKKALMQQILTGKKRLNGFSGAWEEVRLGAVGDISSAGVDKKTIDGETKVRLLNFVDVFRREKIFNHELIQEVTAPKDKINKCNVKKGDIFFTPSSETREELAMSSVAYEDMEGVVYSYHIVRFRLKQKWDMNFCSFIFQTEQFRKQVYRLGDGSGQRYVISQDGFRNIKINIPCLAEQIAIGNVLNTISEAIIKEKQKLFVLKQEKNALMQQLLTGKKRVNININPKEKMA